jgi:collagen triple helix repeat protein
MLSRLQSKLGTAGLVVAIVALVAALTGAAFAANAALSSKQKKEVTKIAKKYAGKPGAPGAPGPAGPAGPAGKDGANGTNGTNGAPGESVKLGTATAGECPDGGITATVGGTKKPVCNGETGFTETLPSGETETGMWGTPTTQGGIGFLPVSFSIPLAAAIAVENVHFVETEGEVTECPGTGEDPEADPGHLCVYLNASEGSVIFSAGFLEALPGMSTPAGVALPFNVAEGAFGYGSWAVTAP